MRYSLFFLLVILYARSADAQRYTDSIYAYRQHYKEEFLSDARSPLKAEDTGYLRFFAPDERFRIEADFVITHTAPSFDMPTHSGKVKRYRQYGWAVFTLQGKTYRLQVLQTMTLRTQDKYRNLLFLPFKDSTNYVETYGGGRYLDLSAEDLHKGKIIIDFNKCYNPYCAYASGYACPIPPDENKLPVPIYAGERNYGREHKE